MADSKKYIGIYNSLDDVQDALDNGQLSNPYVAKTMDNGQLDYNSLSPVDYSQYWCTYYPIDAKIFLTFIMLEANLGVIVPLQNSNISNLIQLQILTFLKMLGISVRNLLNFH